MSGQAGVLLASRYGLAGALMAHTRFRMENMPLWHCLVSYSHAHTRMLGHVLAQELMARISLHSASSVPAH